MTTTGELTEQHDDGAQWALVELLGHRRCYGRISETTFAGAAFILIEQVLDDGTVRGQQMVAPSSVYAITPMTREAVAKHSAPQQITVGRRYDDDDLYDGDDEDSGGF